MVGVAQFGSLAVAVAARARVATLEAQDAQLKAQLADAQTRKQATLAGLVPRPKDIGVEAELTRVEAENKALHGVTAILEQNRVGDPRGYSAYFQALGRTRVSGLWLTGVQVDGSTAELGLRGRALNAELLPGYLAGLAREPALQGKAFGRVEIAQPAPVTLPAKAPAEEGAPPPAPVKVVPPYVEFTLQATGVRPAEVAR